VRGWRTAVLVVLLAACGSNEGQRQQEPIQPPPQSAAVEPRDGRTRAAAHTELGSAYFGQGNLGVALEEAKIALEADSTYAPAHNLLGLIYMELKQPEMARTAFEDALRIDPRDSDANHNMGHFLCETGHELEGVKYFMTAVQNPLYASPAKSYTGAGACYEKAGHMDDAFGDYARAIRLDPNYVPAMLPYARLLMAKGQLDEARVLVNRYNTKTAPTAESLWLLVRIEQRRGDARSARDVAGMLGQRFPDSKEYSSFQRGDFN
jgi:type IV pilus assembly protein PilF